VWNLIRARIWVDFSLSGELCEKRVAMQIVHTGKELLPISQKKKIQILLIFKAKMLNTFKGVVKK